MPVVVREDGERSEGVWIASAVADPLQVTVSGPRSLVDRVRRAVVRLPMAAVSAGITDDSIVSPIELEDASGEIVSSPLLTVTSESVAVDSARIDLEVYPVAEIPVDTQTAVSGIPDSVRTVRISSFGPGNQFRTASGPSIFTIFTLTVILFG